MKTMTRLSVMLAITILCALPALGQTAQAAKPVVKPSILDKMDFGLTYSYKWAKVATTDGPEHNIQGGSIDVVYSPGGKYKGWGLALDVNGESASPFAQGINLSQITAVAGPRYTYHQKAEGSPKATVYAEALVGYVHAFNSLFPSTPPAPGQTYVPTSTSNSIAFQGGAGFSYPITKHIGFRVAELDYIYTRLGNNNNNYQQDIRLTTGVTFHF